jgi:hypothetical protein
MEKAFRRTNSIAPRSPAHHPRVAGGGLGVVGGFVGPTQKPLTAHFTTEVGAGVVRADAGSAPSGDGGTTAVDTGGEVVPTFGAGTTGFATTAVFVGAGPPIAFCCIGPGPPTTTGLLGPPTAVCATAGWEKPHAQRKITDITALFIRSVLVGNLPLAGENNHSCERRFPPSSAASPAP